LTERPCLAHCLNVETDLLHRRLELARFDRAIEVSESLADHRALLTTAELERLNKIVTGEKNDPWRQEATVVQLPSGKTENFSLILDAKMTAREKLHQATELAESGNTIDAAVNLYVDLVLAHVFKDGNRRTGVLASHYLLKRYGSALSGIAIHELGLGDLRQEGQIELLRETIHQMLKFAQKREPKIKK
jgi:prophage maintenance system killer protein